MNYNIDSFEIKAKLAFKTKETEWINTYSPIVVLFSVYSLFHNDIKGRMKVEALLSTIKSQVKGEMLILIADGAHLHVDGITRLNAQQVAKEDGHALVERYKDVFSGYQVEYWSEFIMQSSRYLKCKQEIKEKYTSDPLFFRKVVTDAYATLPDKINQELYLIKTVEDILEQCVAYQILSEKGYRFQFYPGKQHSSINYLGETFSLQNIHVFLSIEKNTKRMIV